MPVREDQIAACEMVFGGQRPDESLLSFALSASVDLAIGKPGMFALEMEGYDENQGMGWMEDDRFALGTIVEVKMGYRNSLESLFYGTVMGIDLSLPASQPPRMTVRAFDLSHRMTRGEKRRAFANLKLSDIARKLAGEAGLTPRVHDSSDTREYVEQKGETDMAFLLRLAEEMNYHLFVIHKEMTFKPALRSASPRLRLAVDDNTLIDFQAHLSLARQVSEVVVQGWDVAKQAAITGRAMAGDETWTMGGTKSASTLLKGNDQAVHLISEHPVMTQEEANHFALARLNKVSLDLIEASGSAVGSAAMLPGEIIEIAGVSASFKGLYCLTGTTHRFDFESGYTTNFSARRNSI
ncbi:MAG TPA: contractile injection system protein, VgrG/Pvc8 family [Blastocatellia bacterium]|nr:contractile injection system protein, VgrG/Pvc8 family [Blastocatellia bacterium]